MNTKKTTVARFRAAFLLFYNAFAALMECAPKYRDGTFVDWEKQAFDVGVNDKGLIVGVHPSGKGNERTGKALREECIAAGAIATNPVSCGPRGNVTRTREAFFTLLDDPTGARTERIDTAQAYLKTMETQVEAYSAALVARQVAARQLIENAADHIEQWIADGAQDSLGATAEDWDANFPSPLPELHIPAFTMAAGIDTSAEDGFDWDAYLFEQFGINRAEARAFVEEACNEACTYLEERKKPRVLPDVPAVQNSRKLK